MADQAALSFGGLLRQLRAEARLTQEELAEAAQLSPRSVSDLERSINRTAQKNTAGLLADALGLTEPVRALFVAAARGRGPSADVLAAREGRTPDAAHAPASTARPYREQVQAARGAIEGERKQVTVLLCDLVGSSDIAAEPEAADAVADRFLQFALEEVRRCEGTINQVRPDGFTALFGAPIGHEDHARRTVLAALGIVAGAEVEVRIGINSGLVVLGAISDDLRVDFSPVGDTAVLAARLQAAAPPGTVLVSQRTAGLVRGYFRTEDVAPVKVEERTLYPVLVTGPDTRTAPVASAGELSPFTGRDREMAELRRALEVAAGGEGQVIGLAGDPGLGKSRLAFEFCRLAEPFAAVIEGRCLSYGASIPYLPVFELVRNACGITIDDSPDRVASKLELRVGALGLDMPVAHYLRHAFGVAAGEPGLAAALDPQAVRDRTFAALRRLLVAEARHRPLVVLVEDLHWIDQTSEDFLAEFVDELPSVPIMLLVTYRSGYLPRWIGKSFTSQLALRPLSLASSHQIVESILAGADLGARAAIAERGEGNPFFLEELASAVRGHAVDAAGVMVPETIQQVLAARIDRLGTDQKAAIQLAAVLGREFPLELAGQVWDGKVPLEVRLQELKGLEFFRERHGTAERTLVFKHALTREVVYEGMPQLRRRHLHGRAGAALEQSQASQRFEHYQLLGYHYSHSADPARAIPYLAAAGDRARDRYANEEAIAAYSQAVSLIEQTGSDQWPDTYGATCESLGSVLVRRSRYDEAIEAYGKGLAVARGAFQRTHLHALCAKAETAAHRYPEALAQCDLAEKALGPAPATPGPQWLSPWFDIQDVRMEVLYWLGDTAAYARLIEHVRSFAEAHGSAEQRAGFFVNAAQLSLRRGRLVADDQTVEFARDAYKAAQEAGPEVLWRTEFNVGFALLWRGELDDATAMLQDCLREAERRGEATIKSRATTYLMVVMRKRGDVDGVREAIPSVIERAREASLPEYEAMAIANRAWVAWHSDEQESSAADAQAALEKWEKLPARYAFDWMALWPLLAMALDAQRIAQAAEYARRMLLPSQQSLQEPARTLVDSAVHTWESGQPAETEELLRRAVRAAADLGYL